MTGVNRKSQSVFLRSCLVVATLLGASVSTPATRAALAQGAIDKLVISAGADVTGLNGADVIVIVPDRAIMDHISEGLVRFSEVGRLEPWLATSFRNIDDVTWEFKLRQGVTFQNGEPFNAAAVKFFYDTMLDPKTTSPSKSNHAFVKEIKIIDDFTIHLITKEPFPVTLASVTMAHMMPPAYVKQVGLDGYRRKPIGTGPFQFVEYVRDERVVLQAYDGYWGGPQRIKTIEFRPIKEDAARVAALLAGEIDVALDVPPELMPVIASSKSASVKQVLGVRHFLILFNSIDPKSPLTKREVREAINYGIDRENLNQTILAGTGAPGVWASPWTFGIHPDIKAVPYDPQRARRLLAEAGYPNGLDLVFEAPSGKYIKDKELSEAVAGQLAKIGIRVEVRTTEWGLLTKKIFSKNTVPMTLIAWGDSPLDPESHIRFVLTSGGTWSQINDPKLDKFYKDSSAAMDPDKRKAILRELQEYVRESFPYAYVVQQGIVAGVSQKAKWWDPRPDERFYFWQNAVAGR